MDLHLFISTFTLIFLAELPDKTAFATVMLAAKGRHGPVFTGVALAFLIQTLVAVTVGSYLTKLPALPVKAATALMFLYFAWHSWKHRDEGEEDDAQIETKEQSTLQATLRAFLVIFAAEFGDLTQLSTAAIAARSGNVLTVFTASLLALWSVTAIAVVAGKKISALTTPRQLHTAAAIVFVVVGSYFGAEVIHQAMR